MKFLDKADRCHESSFYRLIIVIRSVSRKSDYYMVKISAEKRF